MTAPSRVPAKLQTSPSKPALKPSYSHVVKQGLKTPTRDPENTHVIKSRAPPVLQVSCVTHGLCVGVITDTLVITELRGVRVVQIP